MITSQTESPKPDATPTADQLVARAKEIALTLPQLSAETERRTYYADATHREFLEAGFFRMLVPQRYGGYELGMGPFIDVVTEIAVGCASTAWMLALGAQHAVVAASFFSEEAQDELFAQGDFVSPGTTAPTGTLTRASDGGWIVNGTWAFCSGAPYANFYLGHAMLGEPPQPAMFIAPRSQFTRLNDWGTQLGLKGSGSHSIRIENGHIPEHLVLPSTTLLTADVSAGTPGLRLHGNPLYAAPTSSLLALQYAAISVGTARGALAAYREIAGTKLTLRPPKRLRREAPEHQRWYGAAAGIVATAEAALRSMLSEWIERCNRRELLAHDARFVLMTCEIHDLCWQALDRYLFRTAGSSSVRSGERIERIWRDMSTARTHTGVVFLRDLAELGFGAAELDAEAAGDDA